MLYLCLHKNPHFSVIPPLFRKFVTHSFFFMNERYKTFIACSFQLTLSNHHHHYSSFIRLMFIMANTSSTPVHSNVASNHKTGPKKNQKQAGLPDKLKEFVFNKTNAACLLCSGENLPLSHADAQTDHGCTRVYGTVYDLTGKVLNIDQMCLLCKVTGFYPSPKSFWSCTQIIYYISI